MTKTSGMRKYTVISSAGASNRLRRLRKQRHRMVEQYKPEQINRRLRRGLQWIGHVHAAYVREQVGGAFSQPGNQPGGQLQGKQDRHRHHVEQQVQ